MTLKERVRRHMMQGLSYTDEKTVKRVDAVLNEVFIADDEFNFARVADYLKAIVVIQNYADR